jgi:hypothetical protein
LIVQIAGRLPVSEPFPSNEGRYAGQLGIEKVLVVVSEPFPSNEGRYS